MATRRAILVTGGAAALVVAAGASAFVLTRAPTKATRPWRRAGESLGDWRLDALSFAILAPNPHNMQPWRLQLGDGGNAEALTLYADPSRMLPQTDPPNRQITIGLGCFLELFRQAAAQKGASVDLELFPEGEPHPILDKRPIAVIRRTEHDAALEPLFSATLSRRTNRAPFAKRAVPRQILEEISAAANGVHSRIIDDPAEISALKALAREAWRIEWTTDRTRRESVNVTRIGKGAIEETPYGLSLSGAPIELFADAGLLTQAKMNQSGSPAYEQSLDFYYRAIDSAAAFISISTPSNRRGDQIAAGAAWLRIHQAATRAGVAIHPLSQMLQEFPEMAGPYRTAHQMLAPAQGATVQMLARLGYANSPAPREPLETKLIAL